MLESRRPQECGRRSRSRRLPLVSPSIRCSGLCQLQRRAGAISFLRRAGTASPIRHQGDDREARHISSTTGSYSSTSGAPCIAGDDSSAARPDEPRNSMPPGATLGFFAARGGEERVGMVLEISRAVRSICVYNVLANASCDELRYVLAGTCLDMKHCTSRVLDGRRSKLRACSSAWRTLRPTVTDSPRTCRSCRSGARA